jgi:CheY-like chemotaxis protein
MKVLVVDPDLRRAPALRDTLAAGGAEVTIASSGSFALTMLEWNRHDVVVCRAQIDDMEGHELCAILKADPGTRDVRFVLVTGAEAVSAAGTTAAGVDLVLPASMAGSAILPLIVRLMRAYRAPSVLPAGSGSVETSESALSSAADTIPEPHDTAEAPAVPRIRPETLPPPPADPPKRYATAVVADTEEPWAKTEAASPVPPSSITEPPRTIGPASPSPIRGPLPRLRPVPPAPARAGSSPPRPASASPSRSASSSPRTPASGAPRGSAPGRALPTVEDLLAMPSGTFQGSLEVMELADLTQAIAGGGKSGRLILALPQGGGLMLFERGRVVHAEYRSAVGEEAFGALLAASHGDGAGRFCFLPSSSGEASGMPRTIDKTVDQLLLSSATAIDEKG